VFDTGARHAHKALTGVRTHRAAGSRGAGSRTACGPADQGPAGVFVTHLHALQVDGQGARSPLGVQCRCTSRNYRYIHVPRPRIRIVFTGLGRPWTAHVMKPVRSRNSSAEALPSPDSQKSQIENGFQIETSGENFGKNF